MCGIVGMFGKPNKGLLNTMALRLKHRGPDNIGYYIDDNVGFAHTRLSINDLSEAGNQPIESNGIVLVANGEIYDDNNDLRDELSANYSFKSYSDSELLIPLYLKYGPYGMMEHVKGEFAFIIYDKAKHKLYACRDRFGIKPLYYTQKFGSYLFASEPKAFVSKEWDYESLFRSLSMHYIAQDRSYFKNVYQVKPGHMIELSDNGLKDIKYYDINYARLDIPQDDYVSLHVNDYIVRAIKRRLDSTDVDVCAHLSGGLDSSVVVGQLTRLLELKGCTKKFDTFGIVFPGVGIYDEWELAAKTARWNEATFNSISVSPNDIINGLENAVQMSDGLAVNGHIVCKNILNKHIRKAGYKVALTGEGADECFLGYSHLYNDMFGVPENMSNQSKIMIGTETPDGDILDVSAIQKAIGYVPSFLQAKFSMGSKIRTLLSECPNIDFADQLVNELDLTNLITKGKAETSMYIWCKTALANYILRTLGDGCEMPHSIEGRLPFLDHELFDYIASLPIEMKIKKNTLAKPLLRSAEYDWVPDWILNRNKQPFQAPPLTQFFDNNTWDRIYDTLLSDNLNSIGIFKLSKIEKMLYNVKNGDELTKQIYEPIIMLLLSVAALNKTMEGPELCLI